MKKIKLLLIAPTFYPDHGGAGLRFYHYLPYFHQQGIETTVICGTPKVKKMSNEDLQADWQQFENGRLVSERTLHNAKVIKYKIAGQGAKKRPSILLNKAFERCLQASTKPDIVHVIAPMPFQAIKQLNKISRLGVKLIYSHTIAKDFSSNLIVRLLQQWKIKQVLSQYNHILVQSNVQKEILLKIIKNTNIVIIPNGVDTNKFSPVQSKQEKIHLRESLGLPVDATVITLVGAVHPRKGTDLLVEAWSRIVGQKPNLHLVLIGPRYDFSQTELPRFKQKIQQSLDESKRNQNIHFLGQVDCVDPYLKASDMFVFPSQREGMPNAVLEAMSSGLPVVMTPFVGLSKELGVAGKHYLLAERNSESLRENILKLLDDNKLTEQLSLNARRWVLANMSIESSVTQHKDIYLSI